jgi:two-component system cell cycle response regulator DivK
MVKKTPRPARAEEAKARPNGPARVPGAGPLVLVVDDFADNREMYARFLEFSGFQVMQAANGEEALKRAFERTPALVVMDLSLPGLDGWEATRRLKADARTHAVPVVAVTGHALAGSAERAEEAGCDGYITKPCLPADLVAEIRRVLASGVGKGKKKAR